MKFTLTSDYRYPWPVEVIKPDPAKPGKPVTQKFEMIFRQLPDDEAAAIDERRGEIAAMEPGPEKNRQARQHEHELLRRVCVDWNDDVIDDDGEPLPFSVEAFEAALGDVYFRAGVYKAFFASVQLDGGRVGN